MRLLRISVTLPAWLVWPFIVVSIVCVGVSYYFTTELVSMVNENWLVMTPWGRFAWFINIALALLFTAAAVAGSSQWFQ